MAVIRKTLPKKLWRGLRPATKGRKLWLSEEGRLSLSDVSPASTLRIGPRGGQHCNEMDSFHNSAFQQSNSPPDASPSQYYRFVRREILPLLPRTASRILDVGAGVGATSAWLRALFENSWIVALEGNSAAASELSNNVDEFHILDLNDAFPNVGTPDLVLLLDVLEHLVDPWDILRRVTSIMARDATVIVSVPNIAHLSISVPLLLRAAFEYSDAGITDRTHLRFFVRDSAIALLNSAGLEVVMGLRTGFGRRARALDNLTLGLLRDHLTKQYILCGKLSDGPQGVVRWLRA